MKNRKGQMIIEFVIAAIFFFAIIVYVITYLGSNMTTFSSDFYKNELESRVVQISELLIHNEGLWNTSSPIIIGLAKKWPVLDYDKIERLDGYCNGPIDNYKYLLRNLDLSSPIPGYNVKILVKNESDTILDCRSGMIIPRTEIAARVERAVLGENDETLSLTVWVW